MILRGLIFGFSLRRPSLYAGGVQGGGHANNNVRSEQLWAIICAYGNLVLNLGLSNFVDDGVDAEGKVDVLGSTVPHELELAVWRNEGDYAVRVKLTQLDALVELAVLECDGAGGCARGFCPSFVAGWAREAVAVEEEAVVEAEFAFRSAREVGSHDYLTGHVRAQDSSCRRVSLVALMLEERGPNLRRSSVD